MSVPRVLMLPGADPSPVRKLAGQLAAEYERPAVIESRSRGPVERRLVRRGYEPRLSAVPGLYAALRRADPDLVHSFGLAESVAARRWSARTGRPAVLSLSAPPDRGWLLARRRRLDIVLGAVRADMTILVPDQLYAQALVWSLGVRPIVLDPHSPAAHLSLYRDLT